MAHVNICVMPTQVQTQALAGMTQAGGLRTRPSTVGLCKHGGNPIKRDPYPGMDSCPKRNVQVCIIIGHNADIVHTAAAATRVGRVGQKFFWLRATHCNSQGTVHASPVDRRCLRSSHEKFSFFLRCTRQIGSNKFCPTCKIFKHQLNNKTFSPVRGRNAYC